jgi:hypothetical protein
VDNGNSGALVTASPLPAQGLLRPHPSGRAVSEVVLAYPQGQQPPGSSTLVLGEFHSHLLYLRGSAAAREVLARLLADDTHEWLAPGTRVVQHDRQPAG